MLNLIIDIFLTFLKIGAFTFGGGYAMLPLMQTEIINVHHWLTNKEFIDILAISQMTPGPIAVNSATFVGYKIAGFWGSAAATIGVIIVCTILSTIIAVFFYKFKDNKILKAVFKGIRPAVIIMIAWTVFSVGRDALVDIRSIIICVVIFIALFKFKLDSILAIVISGVAGVILFH